VVRAVSGGEGEKMNKSAPWYASCNNCLEGLDWYTWTTPAVGCEECAFTGREPIPTPEVFRELRFGLIPEGML